MEQNRCRRRGVGCHENKHPRCLDLFVFSQRDAGPFPRGVVSYCFTTPAFSLLLYFDATAELWPSPLRTRAQLLSPRPSPSIRASSLIYTSCCAWDHCISARRACSLFLKLHLLGGLGAVTTRFDCGSQNSSESGFGDKRVVGRENKSGSCAGWSSVRTRHLRMMVVWLEAPRGALGGGGTWVTVPQPWMWISVTKIALDPCHKTHTFWQMSVLEQNANQPNLCWLDVVWSWASLGHIRVTATEVRAQVETLLHPSHILFFFNFLSQQESPPHPSWGEVTSFLSLHVRVYLKDTKKVFWTQAGKAFSFHHWATVKL